MTEPQVVSDSDTKPPLVVMEGVNKHFGDLHVLKDIDLTVGKGEVVILIGPSGSGKSTLCRTINRLETFETGSITIDGERLALLRELLAVDADRARLEGLEAVDGAAQGRLPRPRRSDEDDHLALADGEVDVLEDVQVAEVLVDAVHDDERLAHALNVPRSVAA